MDCPEPTWVGLFVKGELSAADVSLLEEHLDGCTRCLQLVAEAAGVEARKQPADSGSVEPRFFERQDSVWVHLVAALARASDRAQSEVAPTQGERSRFGPYQTVRVLGRGAMGIVYSAVHDDTGARVAIKTVAAPSAKSLAAMRQEIRFLRTQGHPGIVRIFDDGVVDGDPWYAMELLEGKTLDDFNRSLWSSPGDRVRKSDEPSPHVAGGGPVRAAGGRLPEVLSIFARLCPPLAFVHRAGIVHCDLKPANVFVRGDGQPVLMDFGLLSRASGAIGRETLEVGGLRGTLPYLAPEVIRGGIPDARADFYALGCMLYESITGRPPFLAPTAHGILEAHLYKEPAPLSELVAGMPGRLEEIVASLLAKVRKQRVGNAEALEDALGSVFASSSRRRAERSRPYLFRPRLAGRDEIVAEIHTLREEAAAGKGCVVLIGGESGIGKTFLASECARLAIRAGFEVITGECVPLAATQDSNPQLSTPALAPFQNLLQRVADRCRGGGPERIAELFGSPRTVRLLARYGSALRHVFDGYVEDIPVLPPPAERERALDAVREVLGRVAAATPLLLIIDDLQWADDLSLAFLEMLSPDWLEGRRLVILGLYRAEESSPAIARLREKEHVRSIALKRLDDHALTEMVGDLLSQAPPQELMRALIRHSEGNPFFVAEYLRTAASEGHLVHTISGWSLAESSDDTRPGWGDLPLPSSLQELVEHRLGLMSDGAQRVAEMGAVLGREFSPTMLAAMRTIPADAIDSCTEEMIARQLADRVGADRLRFAHDKIRESAYARIEPERRRVLHRAAAEAIEQVPEAERSRTSPRYAELAYHFLQGGVPHRAIEYLEKAGEHALRNSANADAVRFFEDAIQTTSSGAVAVSRERRAHWERRIGDALQGLGDLSGSKRHLVSALALFGHPQPASRREMALGIAGKLAKELVHRTAIGRRIETDASRAAALLEPARAYDRLMQIYYYTGEYGPLFFANLATLDLAGRAPPSPTLAVAYTNAGAVAGIVPLHRVAEAYFRLAEATIRESYDVEVDSYRTLIYAHYLSGLGKWSEASSASDRGLQLAESLGFRRRWEDGAAVRSNLGWARDFDDCLAWGERMFESAQRRGDTQMVSWGLLRRAEVHVARGDLAAAESSLKAAEGIVPELGRPEQIRALGLRAILLMQEGDTKAAMGAADRASALVVEAKTIHLYCVEPYARVAQVYLARSASGEGDDAKARAACRTMASAARIFPIAQPRACLLEGARRWHAGDRRAARTSWQRGLEASLRLDVPYEEALLRRSLACDPTLPAAVRENQRARARRISASLGVQPTDVRAGLVSEPVDLEPSTGRDKPAA
jgi:serine/threonine protein kinase/tetratricopeptide (TPR) repeat protein